MCVLAFAWHAHPRWRLVLAGNRDELHARPAAPLARWEEPGGVIAGRDLEAGGTWLGVSGEGRFAVVTNLRGYGLPQPDMASRGALVSDVLNGGGRYAEAETIDLAAFNPFNLIIADQTGARFMTNRPAPERLVLGAGLYGLSNGALDEPWPKTLQLKAMLRDWLDRGMHDPATLLDGLRSEDLPAIGRMPQSPSDAPAEPTGSPIFIRHPIYGTRCSTVVMIDHEGHGRIVERRYTADAVVSGETSLAFDWPD